MTQAQAVQVIQLDGAVPEQWRSFGLRWQEWRQRFDRRHWASSWQGEAWRAGELAFPSPWGEGELVTQLGVRSGLVFGYVLQEGNRRALLLPGWLGGGHELEAVYLLREQVLLLLPASLAPSRWFMRVLAELLPGLVTTSPWPDATTPPRQRRLILEGHPNFAHQILNVLSALEALPPGEGALRWMGQAPFGPMAELFPEHRWLEGEGDGLVLGAGLVLGQDFELPLSQRPERIPRGLRERIRGFCEGRMGDGAKELLDEMRAWRARGGRVLWVSLKTRGARAEGLAELVGAWMGQLVQRGEGLPLLVLDGFSLQAGDSLESCYYCCSVAELLGEERQQAGQVRAALGGIAMPVREAIGFSLAESIALGQAVDAYLCHQGTVQHKLGWCQQGVPGVVHSSSWRSREGSHPWGGLGGAEPLWLPSEFSEDLEQGPRADYRFRPERLADGAHWLADQLIWRTDG